MSYPSFLPQQVVPVEADHDRAQAIGDTIERFACSHNDAMERDGNCHYDATVPGIDGTPAPVQIKGAGWRIKNGSHKGKQYYTPGRFRLYESDHDYLIEEDGWYYFVVYERHSVGLIPLFHALFTARLTEHVFLDGWYENEGGIRRKATGDDYRLPWPRVFPNTGAEP